MMKVNAEPEQTMRVPEVVRMLLSSMKPSATRARPEKALRTVMTTGMSAPPMALEMV
jgi:hypothetical protein